MNPRSAAYGESLSLLVELDDLMRQGLGNSREAEAVRDRMYAPWDLMSPEEQERVDALAADLYTLWDSPRVGQPVTADGQARFRRCSEEGRWLELLTLLHEMPSLASPSDAALLRFHAWTALGEPEIAAKFAAHFAAHVLSNQAPPARPSPPPEGSPPAVRHRAGDHRAARMPQLRRVETHS